MEILIGLVVAGVALYLAVKFWFLSVPLAALAVWWHYEKKRRAAEANRQRLETERRAAIDAQLQRERQARDIQIAQHRKEQEGYRERMLTLGEESLSLFEKTPEHLVAAEHYLDKAEVDFAEQAFAPFWDCIEGCANSLGRFDESIRCIRDNSTTFTELVKKYDTAPPLFPLAPQSVDKLAAGAVTADRMTAIVRRAQRNFQFAMIYEQRKTNQLLVVGFASLAHALQEMTWRITNSVRDLTAAVGAMEASLSDAVFAVGDSVRAVESRLGEMEAAAAEYRERESERLTGQANEAREARENDDRYASSAAERQKKALEMLDNIQRGRRPWN